MGYVYHSNYVSYCHQARTELLRKFGVSDYELEEKGIMLPVITFEIRYKKPAHYDELITVKTRVEKMPVVLFNFDFEVSNPQGELVCTATSTVAFVDSKTRHPRLCPDFVKQALQAAFAPVEPTHQQNMGRVA